MDIEEAKRRFSDLGIYVDKTPDGNHYMLWSKRGPKIHMHATVPVPEASWMLPDLLVIADKQHEHCQSTISDEDILEIAGPFGEFRFGDAQGDKRVGFARAIITAMMKRGVL